jgi:hypothetical protein
VIAIGIDLGVTGAASFVDSRGSFAVEDLPIVIDAGQKRLDGHAFLQVLRRHVPPGEAAIATYEDVRVRITGNDHKSFNTMHSQQALVITRGITMCALDIARIKHSAVQPTAWKKFFGLVGVDTSGAAARGMATKLYPGAAHAFSRVKDHNRAESLLIAHWLLRTTE